MVYSLFKNIGQGEKGKEDKVLTKRERVVGCGGTHLYFQHLGGRDRQNFVSFRTAKDKQENPASKKPKIKNKRNRV